jgi:hypothetical protein
MYSLPIASHLIWKRGTHEVGTWVLTYGVSGVI